MSTATQFQTKEEAVAFVAQLQGMLQDPRLVHLAQHADGEADTNLVGDLAELADVFGKLAQG